MPGKLEHISDTAFWVAHYRAMESRRPDAHFRDPLAQQLASDHGEEIVKKLPWARRSAWAMIVRTIVLDEFIQLCVQEGATTVVNLAAGLDTRPYRLSLPPATRWIEIDLPGIFDYKEEKLKNEKPLFQLQRIRQDLSEVEGRRKVFADIAASAGKTLIISEGLLVYLAPEEVGSLAKDLRAQENFRWWAIDIASPPLVAMLMKWYRKQFEAAGIRMQFAPKEGPDFFLPYGWKTAEFRLSINEAQRLNRMMPGAWIWRVFWLFKSRQSREEFMKNGYVLLVPA